MKQQIETNNEELQKFQDFEHKGWQKAASTYSRFSQLTGQSIGPLLENLRLTKTDYLLDVASGTGILSHQASQNGSRTFGIDITEQMVEVAKQEYPTLSFKVANAEQTGFRGNTFTKVAINHGLIHFARPQIVLSEMYRVTTKDALLGMTLWDSPDRTVAFSTVSQAAAKLSTVQIDAPKTLMNYYTDEEKMRELLSNSGWKLRQFIHLPIVWELDSPTSIIDILMEGTVLMASKLKHQPPEVLGEIKAAVALELKPFTTPENTVKVPQGVLLIIASKV